NAGVGGIGAGGTGAVQRFQAELDARELPRSAIAREHRLDAASSGTSGAQLDDHQPASAGAGVGFAEGDEARAGRGGGEWIPNAGGHAGGSASGERSNRQHPARGGGGVGERAGRI